MWPWGHAAVGFVILSVVTLISVKRWPRRAETLTVLLATQLPDLIDKPLAWSFSVLPSGRSLAHSLLTATALIAILSLVAYRYDRQELLPAFSIGYITHLLTDLPFSVLGGDFSFATFLLWPLLPSPDYATEPSFVAHFAAINFSSWFIVQALGAIVVGVLVLRSLQAEAMPE